MAFAELSNVRLEYFAHGEGPRRVVFIHGFQASARIWRMTQEALPPAEYTSIAINNRGAGGSDAPPDEADFTIPIFAEDAFELVSGLGWRDFTLAGHSMGGPTATQFALDHPELLNGLVLLDPAGPHGGLSLFPGVTVDQAVDRMAAARREQAGQGVATDGVDATAVAAPADLLAALVADIRAAPERRLRGSMRSMLSLRLGERVKDLPMPVLLIAGDADALIPISAMLDTWAKYPPGTGLHVWHGVGHSPNLDCPDELAAVLRRFIEVTIPAKASAA